MTAEPNLGISPTDDPQSELPRRPGAADTQMSTWDDTHLTVHQKAWMVSEAAELDKVLADLGPNITVGDIGCGDSRVLKKLLSPMARYVGFDIEAPTVEQARSEFPDRSRFQFPDAGDYQKAVPEYLAADGSSKFDVLICIGNTLGTLQGDRFDHVRAMFENANTLVISVMRQDPEVTLRRLEYYAQNGYNCSVDWKSGTITSSEWGNSLSWSEADLEQVGEGMKEFGAASYEITRAEPLGLVLRLTRGSGPN